MRKFVFLCLIATVFLLGACADPNEEAPAGGGGHVVNGSFLAGSVHGPEAKKDLTVCQGCHGEPGGPGSDPRFNKGIESAGGNGCESCHGIYMAHPQAWAGPNDTFHYSAGNIQRACTLCHGADLRGDASIGSRDCQDCHLETTDFTLDCTACHAYPPDTTDLTIDSEVISGVDHSGVYPVSLHQKCTTCHGMSESATGGGFAASGSYTLFDKSTDTQGDHWDGNIQMSSDAAYNETNYGCDSAICHLNDPAHRLSDSGLPVDLKGGF